MYAWHTQVWERLKSNRDKLPHAILFYGQKGIGKLEFARQLAKILVCESPLPSWIACDRCNACVWFSKETHPDVRVLQPDVQRILEQTAESKNANEKVPRAAQRILIAQIRQLENFVNIGSHRGGVKIILIHPAESMNVQASNALLKMLEEPPARTLFILVANQIRLLLPTILSRCEKILLPTPDKKEAIGWLSDQNISNPELSLAQTGNAPIDAIALNDEDFWRQREIFLSHLGERAADPIAIAELFHRYDLSKTIRWLQQWVYDLMSMRTAGIIRYHLDHETRLKQLSVQSNPKDLSRFYRDLVYGQRVSHHPLNPKLVLEELILGYATLTQLDR
jgi:DNA polymerase III subunit delta'